MAEFPDGTNSEAPLPLYYARWLRSVTGGPIPAETQATCDNCVMLAAPGEEASAVYFHPRTKCCAFQPHIPNFIAGWILAEEDPSIGAGRAELERRIAQRAAITPGWAGPGSVFGLLYRNTPDVFGRAPELRCHFLTATGGCGVWKHRPGVCATWYCKHVRGATGQHFWRLADKLLRQVEHELSLWCRAELGVGLAEIVEAEQSSSPHVSELGGVIDWKQYRQLWGEWAGRELEFYRACGRLVGTLEWGAVLQICGPRVGVLAGLVRDAYEHLTSDAIPERLRVSEIRLAGLEANGYRVISYSVYDPLVLPEALMSSLRFFDGRPTDEALVAIQEHNNILIDLKLVRKMVDFGLLEPYSESSVLPVLSA